MGLSLPDLRVGKECLINRKKQIKSIKLKKRPKRICIYVYSFEFIKNKILLLNLLFYSELPHKTFPIIFKDDLKRLFSRRVQNDKRKWISAKFSLYLNLLLLV